MALLNVKNKRFADFILRQVKNMTFLGINESNIITMTSNLIEDIVQINDIKPSQQVALSVYVKSYGRDSNGKI